MADDQLTELNKRLLVPNPNLTNFYYYKAALSAENIAAIEALVPASSMVEGNVSGVVDPSYRSSRIQWIAKAPETLWLYEQLMTYITDSNAQMWHFDLSLISESIQFTEYHESYQGHYDWHMDVGGEQSSTRKLSIVIQLSEPANYDGGDLQLMIHRNAVTPEKARGTVVVFPSFLLHRVTPVTRGTRRSLVLWVHGQPYR